MAIAFVNNVGTAVKTTAGTSSITLTPAQNCGAGNLIVASVSFGGNNVGTTATDTKSNTWVLKSQGTTNNPSNLFYTLQDVGTLTTGDTITFNAGGNSANKVVAAMEFSGIQSTSSFDTAMAVGADGTTATAVSSGTSGTTAQANELIIGAISWFGASQLTLTKGVSYTAQLESDENSGAFIGSSIEYQIASATGTFVADGTLSGAGTGWHSIVGGFLGAVAVIVTTDDPSHRPLVLGSKLPTIPGSRAILRPQEIGSAGIYSYALTDGAAQTDSLVLTVTRSLADTGVTQSDTNVVKTGHTLVDAGLAAGGGGTASIVTTNDSGALTGTSGTTIITVGAAGVQVGNTLLVFTDKNATACVDSRGNTYTEDVGLTGAGTAQGIGVWRTPITTGLVNADTITLTHPGAGGRAAIALELSGLTASPLESAVTNTLDMSAAAGSTQTLTGAAPTTNAATRVFAAWCLDFSASAPVAGSGYVIEDSVASTGTVRTLVVEDITNSSTGTPSASLSWTGTSASVTAAIVAYDIAVSTDSVIVTTLHSPLVATADPVQVVRPRTIPGSKMVILRPQEQSGALYTLVAPTDQGVTQTDALVLTAGRALADTGVTQSDSAVLTIGYTLVDTGVSQSDALVSGRTRTLIDGAAQTDALTTTRVRTLVDGAAQSDTNVLTATRSLVDTGLSQSDTVFVAFIEQAVLDDQGMLPLIIGVGSPLPSIPGSMAILRPQELSGSLLTVRALVDTGVTQSDATVLTATRSLVDGGAMTDTTVLTVAPAITDTGVAQSDSIVATKISAQAVFADAGAVPLALVGGVLRIPGTMVFLKPQDQSGYLLTVRSLVDQGVAQTDATVLTIGRTLTDGAGQTETLVTLRTRVLVDTGATQTDTAQMTVTRAGSFTDQGVSQSDTTVLKITRSLTDGAAQTDTTVLTATRVLADTGATQSDSVFVTFIEQAVLADPVRVPLGFAGGLLKIPGTMVLLKPQEQSGYLLTVLAPVDQGATQSDATLLTVGRSLADGSGQTEALVSGRTRTLTDTGTAQTDVLASTRTRSLTDTGASQADSTILTVTRVLVDGATMTDSVQVSFISGQALVVTADPGQVTRPLRIGMGMTLLQPQAQSGVLLTVRGLVDQGTTQTDTTVLAVTRVLADTGVAQSDTTVLTATRVLVDTGASQSDSVLVTFTSNAVTVATTDPGQVTRPLTLGLMPAMVFLRPQEQSAYLLTVRALVDGAAQSDTTVLATTRSLTDAGAAQSENLVSGRTRSLVDTGCANTESLVSGRTRSLTDTGCAQSDSIALKCTRTLADGTAMSDALVSGRTRQLTDTGEAQSDSIVRTSLRALVDTGLTQSDVLGTGRLRPLTDTGLTQTDFIVTQRARTVVEQGVTQSDALRLLIGRLLTDTFAASDSVVATYIPSPNAPGHPYEYADGLPTTRAAIPTGASASGVPRRTAGSGSNIQ